MQALPLALAALLAFAAPWIPFACAHAQSEPGDQASPAQGVLRLLDKAREHRVLLIGELHGTLETPAIVADLAARWLEDGELLIVGLEIWRSEQAALDRYLASAGLSEDRARLLEGPFWAIRDGRSSEAMAGLIERLRQLKLKAPLRVLAFDVDQRTDHSASGASRDRQMGEALLAALDADPDARLLVLAGNFHTRVQASAPWDPEHRFAGHYLAERDPYAVEVMGLTGSAWMCPSMDQCRAWELSAPVGAPRLELGDELNERKHHGKWWLARMHASPPAQGLDDPSLLEPKALPRD